MITPSVDGVSSPSWPRWFVLFACIGALLSCAIAVAIGSLIRTDSSLLTSTRVVLGVLALGLAGSALLGFEVPVASRNWLVPRAWQAFGGKTFACLFGLCVGLGWMTRVRSNAFWLLIGGYMLEEFLPASVVAALAYGLVRGIPLLFVRQGQCDTNQPTQRYMREARGVARMPFVQTLSIAGAAALGAAILTAV